MKQRKKREPQTKDVVKRERKRRGKKCSESDGNDLSSYFGWSSAQVAGLVSWVQVPL